MALREPVVQVLLAVDSPEGLDDVVGALRAQGMSPLVALSAEQASKLVARWRPAVAIVANGATRSLSLLRQLERRNIPVVLVATGTELARAEGVATLVAALLAPLDPGEVARAARIALGDQDLRVLPESIELGSLRLDLMANVAFVDGHKVELPPKELAILVELALRPGEPVSSAELIRRVWSDAAPASSGDVHSHLYRLRTLIGDHRRVPPLIASRRGFGYFLDLQPAGL